MESRAGSESWRSHTPVSPDDPLGLKMFLTRIGFGSTAVINGDVTQVDLPRGQRSGLRQITEVLKDVDDISFTFFQSKDVVRHPLVARILDAYEDYERGAEREDLGR